MIVACSMELGYRGPVVVVIRDEDVGLVREILEFDDDDACMEHFSMLTQDAYAHSSGAVWWSRPPLEVDISASCRQDVISMLSLHFDDGESSIHVAGDPVEIVGIGLLALRDAGFTTMVSPVFAGQ